jgi:hypothetical protein
MSHMRGRRVIHHDSGYHSFGATHKDKVNNFARFIKDFGWTGKWKEDPDSDIVTLNAFRNDNERIDIEWPATQWWPDVWYTFAGYTIKCRNISHAALIAQEVPDAAKMKRAAQRAKRRISPPFTTGPAIAIPGEPGESLAESLATTVPWDKESKAGEIKVILLKHKNTTITWVQTMTGAVKSGMIKAKTLKVKTNKEGRVIIEFADEFGFHACYADCVIGVS